MRIPDEDVVVIPVAVTQPTGVWDEDTQAEDAVVADVTLADAAGADGALGIVDLTQPEPVQPPDQWAADLAASWVENANGDDLAWADLTEVTAARSGTPSADFLQDAHVQQANATTNFGDASFMSVRNPVLGSGQRDAFFQSDFAKLANWSGRDGGDGNALVLRIRVSNPDATLARTLRISTGHQTGKPFVEDSVTWDTRPTRLTNFVNRQTRSIPPGSVDIDIDITLTPAQLTTLTGNWLLVYLEASGELTEDHLNIRSRENLTKPRHIRINLQRGS